MIRAGFLLCLALFVTGCGQKPAVSDAGPHATVLMRDGTTVAGKVIASSPTEVKLAGDDGIERTIPMDKVKSVEYGEAAAAVPPATPAAPAEPASKPSPTGSPAPSSSAPAVARNTPPPPPPAAPASHADAEPPHAVASEITTKTYEVPAGTEVSVRTEETIDSATAAEGQTYAAQVVSAVKDSAGAVVIPRGANAQIIIVSASKGGKIRGASDLVLDLASVSVEGRRYRVSTSEIAQKGKQGVGVNKRTGEYAGGGAALGAIIGAIAGGGKGAAIGAGAGAGAGALGQILTKGGSIKIPVETVLNFKLDQPLRVTAQ